jgi:hypothetical protein
MLMLLPNWDDDQGLPYDYLGQQARNGNVDDSAQSDSSGPAAENNCRFAECVEGTRMRSADVLASSVESDLSFGLSASNIADSEAQVPEALIGSSAEVAKRQESTKALDAAHNSAAAESHNDLSLLWFCMTVQTQVMAELEKLQRILSKSGTRSSTTQAPSAATNQFSPSQTSLGVGGGGGSSQQAHTASAQPGSTVANAHVISNGPVGNSQLPAGKKTTLPPGVRLLYYNVCNRAIKAVDIYRTRVDPLLLWPSLLRPNLSSLVVSQAQHHAHSSRNPQAAANTITLHSSSRFSMPRLSDPVHDANRSVITDLEDEVKELQDRDYLPVYLSFPNHVLVELRPRFPLPPALLTGYLSLIYCD